MSAPASDEPRPMLRQLAIAGLKIRWYFEQVVRHFRMHDCLTRAAALTYTTLFALVPTMTVTYVVLSLFPEFDGVGQQIQEYVFRNFMPNSGQLVYEKMTEFTANSRNLTWISFAFLFVTAFMMLVSMETTFNRIWQVPDARRGMHRLLTYWAVLTLAPALIAAGLLISVYVRALPVVSNFNDLGLGQVILAELPKLLCLAVFTVVYYAVPNHPVPFRHAFIGGFVSMLAFQLLMWIFGQIAPTLSFNVIYGAFAAVPVFLSWIYIVWVIVLSGTIIVRCMSLRRERDPTPEPLVIKAARILRILRERHAIGEGATEVELARAASLNTTEHERIYAVLKSLKVIQTGADDRLFLGRSLGSLNLWDLFRAFPEGIDPAQLENIHDLPGVVEPIRSIFRFGSNEMTVDLDRALNADQTKG